MSCPWPSATPSSDVRSGPSWSSAHLMTTEALLLLADGRWPTGGYAHSGGLEPAIASGSVRDVDTLEAYVSGRLETVGATEAWLAARAAEANRDPDRLRRLDAEADARTPSHALREASRRMGRGLLRSAAAVWAEVGECPARHHAVVLGVVVMAGGGTPLDAARLAVHGHLAGVLTAAPKLMALDTVEALAIGVRLAARADVIAMEGALATDDGPALNAPALELRADDHAAWEVRLFAS